MIYAENILICIALPLCICLFFSNGSAKRFIISFLFGMLTCLISAYIVGYLGKLGDMPQVDIPVFVSPFVEEIVKFAPILFVLLMYDPSEKELLLVGLGVGAGFATFENACYILNKGASDFLYILIRGLAVGVMHIVCLMALTMLLLLLRRYEKQSLPGIAGALTLSMTFHGLYNLLASAHNTLSNIGFLLPIAMAVILQLPYRRYFADDRY